MKKNAHMDCWMLIRFRAKREHYVWMCVLLSEPEMPFELEFGFTNPRVSTPLDPLPQVRCSMTGFARLPGLDGGGGGGAVCYEVA